MDRSFALLALVLCGCAPLPALAAWLWRPRPEAVGDGEAGGRGEPGDAAVRERAAWRRLLLPLAPAAVALALLLGWWLQEPVHTDERLHWLTLAAALPFALGWLRAGLRALYSLAAPGAASAMTVGLLRPRVVVAATLARRLDSDELEAVYAHEAAHARHRDPLRAWLGQLAADLQWPAPAAAARFATWAAALEEARDQEACAAGADPLALAAALVTAARHGGGGLAALVGADATLRRRIEWLLTAPAAPSDSPAAPLPAPPARGLVTRLAWPFAVAALSATTAFGYRYGERLIQLFLQ